MWMGMQYIDYVGTWGPAILGHAPGVVIDAIRRGGAAGCELLGFRTPYEIEMASLICDWVPSIEKVRMVNSGTEATIVLHPACARVHRA